METITNDVIIEEGEEGEGGAEGKMDITDKTDSKALTLRRTIYLTIMSRSHTHTHTHTHRVQNMSFSVQFGF